MHKKRPPFGRQSFAALLALMPISSKHFLSLMSRHLLALSLFTTRHALAPIKVSIDTATIMRFFYILVNRKIKKCIAVKRGCLLPVAVRLPKPLDIVATHILPLETIYVCRCAAWAK
ncbi:MAG: hypothetical protein IK094_02345 [Treponema sp.]|nr:hypothetical protein [Treponema sp.]